MRASEPAAETLSERSKSNGDLLLFRITTQRLQPDGALGDTVTLKHH